MTGPISPAPHRRPAAAAADRRGFVADRPLWPAMRRGAAQRCPSCGKAPLFRRYLKPHDACGACGLAFSGHRADDLPPYLTVFVTAHLVAPGIVAMERLAPPPLWAGALLWSLIAIAICLLLLPVMKGAVIGQQWAWRMHGFHDGPVDAPTAPDRVSDPMADLS